MMDEKPVIYELSQDSIQLRIENTKAFHSNANHPPFRQYGYIVNKFEHGAYL